MVINEWNNNIVKCCNNYLYVLTDYWFGYLLVTGTAIGGSGSLSEKIYFRIVLYGL